MPFIRCARRAALLLLASVSSAAFAAPSQRQPIVVTIDGHHYVSYGPNVAYSPPLRLVQAPELRIDNCRRSNGDALAGGAFRLVYGATATALDATAMNMRFHPMQIEMATQFGDVVCDGEAAGWEHGVGRWFVDSFELALPQT